MSAERIELSTNGLKGHCSTIELRARDTHFNTHSEMRQRFTISCSLSTLGDMRLALWLFLGLFHPVRALFSHRVHRAEQQRQLVDGFQVIFALAANVADPGREIGNGDQLFFHPGEIRNMRLVHLPDIAFTARDHTVRFAVRSQINALS